MAEADIESTEFWDFDKATRYVVEITGKPLRAAMREVTKRICDDELPHYVNGAIPKGDPEITPSGGATLWRTGDLILDIVKGRVEVVSNTVVVKGYDFRVDANDMRRLWPARPPKRPRTDTSCARVVELLNGPLKGKVRPGVRPHEVEKAILLAYKARWGGKVSRDTIARALKEAQGN
jgi:hypothetical protein